MKRLIITTISLIALCGCNNNTKTPDQIRQDASNAASQAGKAANVAVADTRAAVQGVQDGLKLNRPTNINTASESDLTALPGIDTLTADKIISGRPYTTTSDLADRHIVSRAEYDRISAKINAN